MKARISCCMALLTALLFTPKFTYAQTTYMVAMRDGV
jgi:hypothetical protein